MEKATPAAALQIRGSGGLLEGVSRKLLPGETLVIGRSRSCDLSLRRTRAFRQREDAEQILGSAQFNRVSRIHCEIEYLKDRSVEIRDLSQNGTFVDGIRVGRSQLVKLDGRPVTLELVDATWGRLVLVEKGAAGASSPSS